MAWTFLCEILFLASVYVYYAKRNLSNFRLFKMFAVKTYIYVKITTKRYEQSIRLCSHC